MDRDTLLFVVSPLMLLPLGIGLYWLEKPLNRYRIDHQDSPWYGFLQVIGFLFAWTGCLFSLVGLAFWLYAFRVALILLIPFLFIWTLRRNLKEGEQERAEEARWRKIGWEPSKD